MDCFPSTIKALNLGNLHYFAHCIMSTTIYYFCTVLAVLINPAVVFKEIVATIDSLCWPLCPFSFSVFGFTIECSETVAFEAHL